MAQKRNIVSQKNVSQKNVSQKNVSQANESQHPVLQKIVILGSTGSIGISTLDVVARHSDHYQVWALTANKQVERMLDQCRIYRPAYAVMVDADAAMQLETKLRREGLNVEVLSGIDGLLQVVSAPEIDTVMAAIVGAAGLLPSLKAAQAGKKILLANKEALVMSGALFMEAVRQSGAVLLPIDSEHNAVFQCMPVGYREGLERRDGLERIGVTRILLTASGGPFRTRTVASLENVTPEQACAHPNWQMGRKISVDSATMMNKGLEVIEACWLFAAKPQQVEVVLHPQSIIHSMVEYVDGSVLAQLGNPDMRTPIAHALAWPQRFHSGSARLDLCAIGKLEFEPPDLNKFTCLSLAYQAMERGGSAPTVLNAANEVAVQAFLDRQIGFLDIARVVEKSLIDTTIQDELDLDTILAADALTRRLAENNVAVLRTTRMTTRGIR